MNILLRTAVSTTLLFLLLYAPSSLLGSNITTADSTKIEQLLSESKNFADNDPIKSLESAQKALDISNELDYEWGKSESMRRIGIYYLNTSDFPNALDNFLKALRIAEKINHKPSIARCLMNLGGLYYDYGEGNLALSYFNKSLKIGKEINDKNLIAGCLTNSANVHMDMGDYKSALDNYHKALEINNQLRDVQGMSIILSNIGNVYFYQKKYKEAEKNYLLCKQLKEKLGDKQGLIICCNNLGNLYLRTGELGKAIESSSTSLEMARSINSKDDIYRASLVLTSAFKQKGDYKTALAYHELAVIMKDSIFSESKNKEIGKLESKFELEKRETQIKLLKKDKALEEEKAKQQLLNRNLIIVAIVLLSFVIVAVVQQRNNRKIKRINQQLILQNKEIQAKSEALSIANEELDNFVYRSSHDLKAPLTSVLGLINITKSEAHKEELKLYLQKMQESVDRLMLVLKDLSNYSRNSRLEILHEVINFEQITQQVLADLRFFAVFSENINLTHEIDGEGMFVSDPVRIAILLNNLVSNAITHNDFTKTQPFVEIKITYNPESAKIIVTDSGVGIPKEHQHKIYDMFFKGSNSSQGSGLGLYIVKGVIKKLKGSIHFTSSDAGSTFTAIIPSSLSHPNC